MFYFANWGYLILLLLVPALLFWYIKKGRYKIASIRYSSIQKILLVAGKRQNWKNQALVGIKLLATVLIILALARPQIGNSEKEYTSEGIDIMLVMDISSSMLAEDFKPNRLEAAKSVAMDFVNGRRNDRIGVIVFAAESFIQCPLTIDYDVLESFIDQIEVIEQKFDGTAVGMAIANGVNRLRDSEAKSKVMILVSDGRNNQGELDPLTAAEMATAFDIKIYTIGAGTEGKAPFPQRYSNGMVRYVQVDVRIDEEMLTEVAEKTGGAYFRATDETSLSEIYAQISEMEKTEIKVKEYTNFEELYYWFLFPGVILLMAGVFLEQTIWRRIP